MSDRPVRIPFLGVAYDDASFEDVCDEVRSHVKSGVPAYTMALNLDILVRADKDQPFHDALMGADLILMDSTPLTRVARRRGLRVREKLSGSDLMPRLCERAPSEGWSVFILGGAPGVPEVAAERLSERFPGLRVTGTLSPEYGFERDPGSVEAVAATVRECSPDILFVCLGEPKQGMLMSQHLAEFGVPFAITVGAAVDFAAGNVRRAPAWIQRAGFEWLYRFMHEPRRLFKRYFVDSWRFLSIVRRHGRGN